MDTRSIDEKLQEIKDYFDHPAYSQSRLKTLEWSGRGFNSIPEKDLLYREHEHFIIGSGADTKLTLGTAAFKQLYHCASLSKKPTSQYISTVMALFEIEQNEFYRSGKPITKRIEDISEEIRVGAMDLTDFGSPKWLMPTKLSKLSEGGQEYYTSLIESIGKQVLSHEELLIIDQIVFNLQTNPRTSKYFQRSNKIEVRTQVAVYFEYRGHRCKALLDAVIINHESRTVQIIDLKTMAGYTSQFPTSMKRRRYDIQMAFYRLALKQSDFFYDYDHLMPIFLVESTDNPGTPLDYRCSEDLINMGRNGSGEVWSEGILIRKQIIGFEELIDNLEFYQANGFDTPRYLSENRPLILDWDIVR